MRESTLREVLAELHARSDRSRPSAELLADVWETLLGSELGQKTAPAEWRGDTLRVAVPSEQWAREMQTYPARFEGRLERLLPWDVPEIEFFVDPDRFYDAPADGQARDTPATADAGPDPADPAEISPEARDSLDTLDERARESALRILGHIEEDDK